MRVGIFLSTTSENKDKMQYMTAFAEGIASIGQDTFFLTKSHDYRPCDIAVIFGFYGINMGDIHQVRKRIYTEHTIKRKKNCIFIDADLFKSIGENCQKDQTHVRISYGSIFFDKAKHFNENSNTDRWELLKQRKGITLSDYRISGEHILLCLNSNPLVGRGWSAGEINIYKWAESTIKSIRNITDRRIVVRFHPNAKPEEQKKIPIEKFMSAAHGNISFSGGVDIDNKLVIKNTSLIDDCKNAWACVVYNTSASTAPIISGIPVFTNINTCPVYEIANHNLDSLNKPKLIDRTQWLADTSYCLWNHKEIRTGEVWKRFRSRLNEKGDFSKQAAQKKGKK